MGVFYTKKVDKFFFSLPRLLSTPFSSTPSLLIAFVNDFEVVEETIKLILNIKINNLAILLKL